MVKKIFSLLMLLMIALPCSVLAAEDIEIEAGISPDSVFYGIDVWADEMRVKMARQDSEKARLRIEIAEERFQEMVKLKLKNKEKFMLKAQQEHEKNLEELDVITEDLEDDVKNSVQEKLLTHIMHMEKVMVDNPSEGSKGLEVAIENANQKFERIQNKIQVKNRNVESNIRQKINSEGIQLKTKLKIRGDN